MNAPLPPPLREAARLAALYRYEILDSPPEKELDDIVHLASYICNTPISLISLVDSDRQWFKSKVGLTATETSRYIAFCSHTILGDDLLIVPDALADERFMNNPLVTGDPHVRFYCGAPLITPDGYRIGVLNVIDHVPRDLSAEQLEAIRVLSRQVMDHLTLDRKHRELIQAVKERQRAEGALQRNEAKFRVLSETTSSGIYIYSEDRVLYANPAATTITGYRLDELLAMSLWDLVHPAFQEQLHARVRAVQQGEGIPVRFEFQIVRKDGEARWLDFTAASIEFDGQHARIGTAYDITERKQAQDAVQAREQHLRNVLNSLFAFVGILAPDGTVIEVNQAPLELAGLSAADVLGKRLWDCFWVNYDSAVQADMRAACERAARGEFSRYDVAVRMAGDRLMTIDFMIAPLRSTIGEITYLIPSGVDITERKQAEAALRRNEERLQQALADAEDRERTLRTVLDSEPECVKMLDAQGAVLTMNRAGLAMVEADALVQVEHQCLYPLIEEEDREPFRRLTEAVFQGESGRLEFKMVGLKGTQLWLETHASPLRDQAGAVKALLGITRDITDKKRVDDALRVSEARLRAILDNSPLIVFLKDRDGRYLFINRTFERRFVLSHDQVIGKTDDDLFSPKQAAVFRSNDRDVLRTGTSIEFEEVAQYGDGEHVSIVVKFPLRDAKGTIYALCGIITDITERKKVEEALRQSEERFRLVALATNDVLWDRNLVTNEAWESPNARQLFGNDPDSKPSVEVWSSRLHPDDRARLLNSLDEAMKGLEESWSGEYRFRLADGSYGYFMDRGHIVRDAKGKPVRLVGAMIDVTGAMQAYASLNDAYARLQAMSREVQVAEEKERRRLSRELHDEFGQLLSALMFDLSDIGRGVQKLRGPAASTLRKKAKLAMGTVDRLFVSFREVLAALRPAVLDVLGLVPAIEALASELQERTGLRCCVVAERGDFGQVCGPDVVDTIYRMTQELLMNIVRHAEATETVITLDYTDGWAMLEVRDDGSGFAAQRLPQKGRFGIRGVRERAELLGGRVEIRSEPDSGTVVTVRLPTEPPLPGKGAVASPRLQKSVTAKKRGRHGKEG